MVFRINLPLALLTTLYTNPLTIVPLYVVAFELGQWVLGDASGRFVAPPEYVDSLRHWVGALLDWMVHLGEPLAVGLVLLATLLALLGYGGMRLAWRIHLLRVWHRRRAGKAR